MSEYEKIKSLKKKKLNYSFDFKLFLLRVRMIIKNLQQL